MKYRNGVFILFFAVIAVSVFVCHGQASENFFRLRVGDNKGKSVIYQNSSPRNFRLGFKHSWANANSRWTLSPYVLYGIDQGLYAGVKFQTDSSDKSLLGPELQYYKSFKIRGFPLRLFLDFDFLLGLDNKPNTVDLFVRINNNRKEGFYFGSEVWYSRNNNNDNVYVAPIRIGWKFKNPLPMIDAMLPFFMYRPHFRNGEKVADRYFFGVNLYF